MESMHSDLDSPFSRTTAVDSREHYTAPVNRVNPEDFQELILLAIQEDAPAGDPTSESIFSAEDRAIATVISREPGILCGLPVIETLIQLFLDREGGELHLETHFSDGDRFQAGDRILSIEGTTRALLRIERILLNFLQYLSGISTRVSRTVELAGQHMIVDTRKTLPGYRKLVKYAVFCGGGVNHRITLSDMILIKDNHIAAAGGVEPAIRKAREKNPEIPLEIEVESLKDLQIAIPLKPDYIMLDNMDSNQIGEALRMIEKSEIQPPPRIEISGGWKPERLHLLAHLAPLRVSMGFLTGETRLLDFSLEIIEEPIS